MTRAAGLSVSGVTAARPAAARALNVSVLLNTSAAAGAAARTYL